MLYTFKSVQCYQEVLLSSPELGHFSNLTENKGTPCLLLELSSLKTRRKMIRGKYRTPRTIISCLQFWAVVIPPGGS